MSEFKVASFNVKNLIGADKEYYRFERYTPEEHAWKENWLAVQLLELDADIVGFQEIFEQPALEAVIAETNALAEARNSAVIPDQSKRYARKMIFRKLAFELYEAGQLFWAGNIFDGEPGHRRPGLAILSRHGFVGTPEIVQKLDDPIRMEIPELGGDGSSGEIVIDKLSRPIIKARVNIDGQVVSVINCHLKSKLGEFVRPNGAPFAAEQDLTNYDPIGRAMGEARATVRRMAEALAVRRIILAELAAGYPVIAMGDFNDSENAVSSAIITGEKPFKNYAWMRRHDAKKHNDRYKDSENVQIRGDIEANLLTSAERLFVRKSLRDMVYTSVFGGVYESIDAILLSHHFHPDNAKALGEMTYLEVFNDHLTDGGHEDAPYNKLASDHGQLVAHMRLL